VEVESGRGSRVPSEPGPLDAPCQVAIRARAETWRNVGQPVPPPMYHGIWAATFRRDMKLDGDVLVLMQNLRCVTRQIELLRTVGSRSEEHTSELQSRENLVCRLLLEKKKKKRE